MTQTTAYLPAPVTQRDGSALASSNCRMASIACGLDYETLGAETSTGATMRSYTDDQSGGTDSGDAKQSWDRGYSESLTIRDGGTFDDVMADLQGGHLVHLDVWAAACGGPVCQSGSGEYGHTVAVLCDQSEDGWLVSDPWCNPAKWSRVSTSRLRAGAEEWGRRVYGETGGVTEPVVVRHVVKRLMNRSRPDHIRRMPGPAAADTGGVKRVLWTVTRAYAPTGGDPASGGEVMGDTFVQTARIGLATVTLEGGSSIMPTNGSAWYHLDHGYQREVVATVTLTSGKYSGNPAHIVKVPGRNESGFLLTSHCAYVPDVPTDVEDAVAARDDEWEDALRSGEAWPTA